MKPFFALVFPFVLLFCGCGTESATTVQKTLSPTEQAAAATEINKLGGRATLNKSGYVIHVILGGPKITDTELENLKGLTSLKTLVIVSPKITDAGLEHLKGLASLTNLNLFFTKVTDAGVSKFKAALPKCNVTK